MNTSTILDLIAAREAAACAARDDLRQQQAKLTAEVAAIDAELADLATTRQTLTKILGDEVTASEPVVISESYQQILAVFIPDRGAPGSPRAHRPTAHRLREAREPVPTARNSKPKPLLKARPAGFELATDGVGDLPGMANHETSSAITLTSHNVSRASGQTHRSSRLITNADADDRYQNR